MNVLIGFIMIGLGLWLASHIVRTVKDRARHEGLADSQPKGERRND